MRKRVIILYICITGISLNIELPLMMLITAKT